MEAINNVIPINYQSQKYSVETIDEILDSLYSIRLSLVSAKIKGQQRILKAEFKSILDIEKQKSAEVSTAIDDLFKDLFIKKEDNVVADDKPLSLEEMIQSAENNINKVQQDKVLTKSLPQMRDNSVVNKDAA